MNPLFKKLHSAAEDIKLSDVERDSLRQALAAHIHANPIAAHTLTPSPYRFFSMPRAAAFAIIPFILILGAGGTAYAAEGALPGDMLYPVKISVNEQVQSSLAFSPAAKAQVHVALAEKRLEEAQALAVKGRLNATTTAQIETNLDAHANEAQALTKTVALADPDDATQIRAELASSLSANSAVLQGLGNRSKDESTRKDIAALASTVRVHVNSAILALGPDANDTEPKGKRSGLMLKSAPTAKTNASSTETASTTNTQSTSINTATALQFGQRATKELADTVQLFAGMHSSFDAATATSVQSELISIQQTLDLGSTALAAGDSASAYANFTQAYAATVRIETLLKAASRLGPGILSPILTGSENSTSTPPESSAPDTTDGSVDIGTTTASTSIDLKGSSASTSTAIDITGSSTSTNTSVQSTSNDSSQDSSSTTSAGARLFQILKIGL